MTAAHRSDALVVGGGLAGAAAAIQLAHAGRDVTLLERDRDPKHKVCGEFLSAEAVQILDSLGVSPLALGAVPIHIVRLCSKGRVVASPLPFPALSLTRKRLDAGLLDAAAQAGVQVHRGAAVQTLLRSSSGWQATLPTGEIFEAPDAILATGKHDLRGLPRPRGVQSDLVAMKMYLRLAPAQAASLAGTVELLLHPGGYAGLQPIEGGAANLCGLIRRSTLKQMGGGWDTLFAHIRRSSPHAAERLDGAIPLLPRPLAVSPIPYGFVRARALGQRLWAVGDQAAVIPSFTGDGMSIALFSGSRAARSLLAGDDADVYQRRLHRDLRLQVSRATAISRALVWEPSKHTLVAAARLWPSLLRWTAVATRLPAPVVDGLQLAT